MEATREPPINTCVSLSPRNYQAAMLLSQHNKATPGRSASITGHNRNYTLNLAMTTSATLGLRTCMTWAASSYAAGVVSKVVSKVFKSWKPKMHQNAIENVQMFPIEIAKTWVFFSSLPPRGKNLSPIWFKRLQGANCCKETSRIGKVHPNMLENS